jgi:hypothetical protein
VPSRRRGYIANGVIVAGGIVVLLLLSWGHLGLGALIMPPAPAAPRQVTHAGPYTVTLALDAGQLTVGDHNSAVLTVTDASGRPVDGARVRVIPHMTTMAMESPEEVALAQEDGRYRIHPVFAMAGQWRLDVSLTTPGQSEEHTSFDVGVRWS